MKKLISAITLIIALCVLPRSAYAQSTVDIKEWEVPWENSRPRDPFAESETSIWFVGQLTGYLARLDVETGDFKKIDLEEGSGPHNLIVDDSGIVWYAGNRTASIGRHDPKTTNIEKIAMPDAAAADPHTLVFDGKGHIWFTVQRGNFVGRLNMASRQIDLVSSKTERVATLWD